jgi:hypothetical protein
MPRNESRDDSLPAELESTARTKRRGIFMGGTTQFSGGGTLKSETAKSTKTKSVTGKSKSVIHRRGTRSQSNPTSTEKDKEENSKPAHRIQTDQIWLERQMKPGRRARSWNTEWITEGILHCTSDMSRKTSGLQIYEMLQRTKWPEPRMITDCRSHNGTRVWPQDRSTGN